jgi:hypothetical protein
MWPNSVIRGLLVIEMGGMLAWLSGYAYLSLLGGLIGFYEFWRLPLGIGVVALLLLAFWVFEYASEGRFLAVVAFVAAGAAILFADRWDGLLAQILRFGLAGCALVGIGASIASYSDQKRDAGRPPPP